VTTGRRPPDPGEPGRPPPRRFRRRPAAAGAPTVDRLSTRPGGRWILRAARSLTLRVVAATLLLSALVVCLAGWFLLSKVAAGLEQSREKSAVSEAATGIASATQTLADTGTADPGDSLNALTQALSVGAGSDANPLYDVVVFASTSVGTVGGPLQLFTRASHHQHQIEPSSVPERLRAAVQHAGDIRYTVTPLSYRGQVRTVPGIVVGGQLDIADQGQYEIYYLFPLSEQVESLALVERAVAFAGIFLVLGLSAVAALVTRQVVRPVRAAALAAERYADGDFAQRLTPGGTDDIARLATAFDDMASNLDAQFHRLQELSRVQRRFVADVSHELRTPLTTVRMAADVLYEGRDDLPVGLRRTAELMQTQLDRFEGLLVDLLEISRFDAGAAALDTEQRELAPIVSAVVDDARPLALRRGCAVRKHLPPGPITAEIDPRRLQRILRNLVVNAIEHSEGEPIDITLAGDRDTVAIVVRDHGVGLRPGDAQRVFDRFWRADPARARTIGGTGLGLSIAREDAHLHGGEVDAWGLPGGGSSFRLLLPRHVGAPVVSEPLPLIPDDAPGGRGAGASVGLLGALTADAAGADAAGADAGGARSGGPR
jgi:two-component system sensor histidine kinase MtrB